MQNQSLGHLLNEVEVMFIVYYYYWNDHKKIWYSWKHKFKDFFKDLKITRTFSRTIEIQGLFKDFSRTFRIQGLFKDHKNPVYLVHKYSTLSVQVLYT